MEFVSWIFIWISRGLFVGDFFGGMELYGLIWLIWLIV